MSGPLFKFLGLIALAGIVLLGIFASTIFGAKSLKIGEFTYNCKRGGGALDGYFCETEIGHPYYLMSSEFQNERPYLAFKSEHGSAGILNLEDGIYIIEVGFDDSQIVARTSDNNIHMFMRTEYFPESIGVLNEEAMKAYLRITPIPELRPAINPTN